MELFTETRQKTAKENFFIKLSKLPIVYSTLLVTLTAIISIWVFVESFSKISQIIQQINIQELQILNMVLGIGKYIVIITIFIATFVHWLCYSLICFLLLKLFGKNESFERILSISAYKHIFSSLFLVFVIFWLKSLTSSEMTTITEIFRADINFDTFSFLISALTIFSGVALIYFLSSVAMIVFMIALLYYAFNLKLWQAVVIVFALEILRFIFFI